MTKKLPFAEKYASTNPLSRYLVCSFIRSLLNLAEKVKPGSVLEVGCGEGFLALALGAQGYSVLGLDVREEALAFARQKALEHGLDKKLEFNYGDIYSLPPKTLEADLLVCCEVLEHLENPEKALEEVFSLPIPYAIFSVPREPLWRILNIMRLHYIKDLGNTPGHINHWSKKSFRVLIETRYRILQVSNPLPWTMLLCEKK